MKTQPCYGVTMHCSPGPKQTIGYLYPEGLTGHRVEQWRIPYDGPSYSKALRLAKRVKSGLEDQSTRFYELLNPAP